MTVFADEGMFGGKAMQRWKLVETRANGSPGFAIYRRTGAQEYQPFGVHVLRFEGEQLSSLISFIDPTLPGYFASPRT
jgi:hypothetical protein